MVSYKASPKRRGLFSNLSITTKLIIVNVAVFFLVMILASIYGEERVFSSLALTPINLFAGKNIWAIVTHMFLHANALHLLFNMFSLWFIGKTLEKIIGSKRLFWYYIISGIVAGLFFSILAGLFGGSVIGERIFGSAKIAGVGASGAIFGLLGVMTLLVPKTRIYLIAGPLIALIAQAILEASLKNEATLTVISLLINIYILISVFAIMFYNPNFMKIALPIEMRLWVLPIVAIVPLVIISLSFLLPIANTAHLGGFLAGLAFGAYLRNRYKNKVRLLERVFK